MGEFKSAERTSPIRTGMGSYHFTISFCASYKQTPYAVLFIGGAAARRLAHYVSHVKWLPLPPPKLKNKTRIKHSIHLQLPPRSSTSVMTSTPDRVVMCLDLLGSNVG